jgi:ribosomal protein S18 acetylase RimI-like enzyme
LNKTRVIRPITGADNTSLWAMLEPVFRANDTYSVDPNIGRDAALRYWTAGTHSAYLAEGEGPLGTYFICPNQQGGGAHVCNCGFVTAPDATGKGVARAMLTHAMANARAMGFRAMQFNFVISTNTRAIAIWERHGFDIVGRLPAAFNHPVHGYVDALVMYQTL